MISYHTGTLNPARPNLPAASQKLSHTLETTTTLFKAIVSLEARSAYRYHHKNQLNLNQDTIKSILKLLVRGPDHIV